MSNHTTRTPETYAYQRRWTLLLVALVMFAWSGCKPEGSSATAEVKIAAASNLTYVFKEVAKEYERRHGQPVTLVFGSSGLLAKQISEGAPFDAYFSANVAFVEQVVAKGVCDGSTVIPYARSGIVLWSRSAEAEIKSVADLRDDRFKKIAIANPEFAPYGRAAKQALERSGIWEQVEPRIVMADNVKHAQQYAQTGNADVAILPAPLAVAEKSGHSVPIDHALHDAVEQTAVICKRGTSTAGGKKFVDFVVSPEGFAILERFGFIAPGG
ncbi:molybdate ABC transporter substrate-binding protein [Haliangium sp.]|uniref:molybdate ABC transporter substrate-binding protein n=1 Tax=Haliangium sp. TaxID=2663208 RepID=UPI003D0D458E